MNYKKKFKITSYQIIHKREPAFILSSQYLHNLVPAEGSKPQKHTQHEKHFQ